MEFYLDSRAIIAEVEKLPVLYNKSHFGFNNRKMKLDGWMAVCENIVSDWDQTDQHTRMFIRKEVQNKWKCMRDAYWKSLKIRHGNNQENPQGYKIRKPYIHHKYMAFLQEVDSYEPRDLNWKFTKGSKKLKDPTLEEDHSYTQDSYEGGNESLNSDNEEMDFEGNEAAAMTAEKPGNSFRKYSNNQQTHDYNRASTSSSNFEKATDSPIDPDEMFIMSQMHYIKNMLPEDKLQFQIGFTQLIHKYSNKSCSSTAASSSTSPPSPTYTAPSSSTFTSSNSKPSEEENSVLHILSSMS